MSGKLFLFGVAGLAVIIVGINFDLNAALMCGSFIVGFVWAKTD